ncbi:SDR family NAD(P)-dependent oxidoreductase [Chloroflexota bacterium]
MRDEKGYLSHKELFDLTGKVAVITGAASGIGFAIAKRLVRAGSSVLIADINSEKGKSQAKKLASANNRVDFVKCDVTQESDVSNMVNTTVKTFGRLDIMVNNAGIYPLRYLAEMDLELWDRVHHVNLRGIFLGCQKAGLQMIKQGSGGTIVNVVSIGSFYSTRGLTAYDSSKGGARTLTRTMAVELAPYNIRVNSVSPGPVVTEGFTPEIVAHVEEQPMPPLGRRGVPEDVARVVLCLACPAFGYITGSDVIVDGGLQVGPVPIKSKT